jgi:hypothetical protein
MDYSALFSKVHKDYKEDCRAERGVGVNSQTCPTRNSVNDFK